MLRLLGIRRRRDEVDEHVRAEAAPHTPLLQTVSSRRAGGRTDAHAVHVCSSAFSLHAAAVASRPRNFKGPEPAEAARGAGAGERGRRGESWMQEREVHEGRLLGEGEKDHRFECLVTKTSPTCSACSSSAKDTNPP